MYVELDPPPFMEKSILNFHLDYLIISLTNPHFIFWRDIFLLLIHPSIPLPNKK